MLVLKTTDIIENPAGLQVLTADRLLADANGGVPWLVHVGFTGSYSGESPVLPGATVNNLVTGGASSSVIVPGTGPTVAGGGFDFANASVSGTYLTIPPAVADAIDEEDQEFMFCAYVKLPTSGNWITASGQNNPILNWCNTATYTSQDDILHVGMSTNGGVPILNFRRQTDIGTAESLNHQMIDARAAHFGQVCQIAYWKDADGRYSSIKSAAGGRQTVTVAGAATLNAATITGLTGKIGLPPIWNALDANEIAAKSGLRVYRAFVELPGISGRSPLGVLDADFTREIVNFS